MIEKNGEEMSFSRKQYYISVWVKGFRVLKGWTEQETIKWAHQWNNMMEDEKSMFYHDDPVSYLVEGIVPRKLRLRLQKKRKLRLRLSKKRPLSLLDELYLAITGGGRNNQHEINWLLAKEQVNRVLNDWGIGDSSDLTASNDSS